MRVCSGAISFRDLVVSSQALDTLKKAADKVIPLHPNLQSGFEVPLSAGAMPLLSGLSLTEYTAVGIQPKADGSMVYSALALSGLELRKLISSLHQDFEVSRFINIGPASTLRGSDYLALGSGEIESLDSIDLDPMLGWFWRSMRLQSVALAQ
jgi:hypothetical protein